MMTDHATIILVGVTARLFSLFLCLTISSFGQSHEFERAILKCLDAMRIYDLNEARYLLHNISVREEKEQKIYEALNWKLLFLTKGYLKGFPSESIGLFNEEKSVSDAVYHLLYSDYAKSIGVEEVLVFQSLSQALSIGNSLENQRIKCAVLNRMIDVVNYKQEDYELLRELINEYENEAYDKFEKDFAYLFKIRALSAIKQLPYIEDFLEGKKNAIANGNMVLVPYFDKLIGVKYEVYADYLEQNNVSTENYRKSLIHYDLSISGYSKYLPAHWAKKRLTGIYINKGINYHFQKKLDSANFFLNAAKRMIVDSSDYDNILISKWKGENYKVMSQMDSAYFFKNLEVKLRRASYSKKTDVSISEISTKYQTEEKEKQILIERQKARNNRNWLIASTLALLLGSSIAVLLQKNTTKKRRLAEQATVLEQQRVDNLLKEQELVSIDAMIAGQEKERQKVAGELHDDLGSLMATIKLHFDNAKVGKKDPALQSAQKLLEEAYQKIRGMAHHKNSGVMSDQGLLSAIQKMAKTITATNAMQVTVEDFGLGERLENSLELSIFRMVQELVANAIKHAEATKVNIQLTQYEDNLNIIVEDNGKGFDRAKLDKTKSGMGLTNIEKRVEHLEGSFTVDSIVGKGTSILIDIPV